VNGSGTPHPAGRGPRSRVGIGAGVLAFLLLPVLALAADPAPAPQPAPAGLDSPVGLWRTVSDIPGKPGGLVRLSEKDGVISGVIERVLDEAKRNERCEKCPGERHNLKVEGITFLTGMHRDGDTWRGGEILDPDNGNVYDCKMVLEDGGRRLRVRGFLGISLLGRTQFWTREP